MIGSPPHAMGQAFVMLTIYEEGQAYTAAEYWPSVVAAGFVEIRPELGVGTVPRPSQRHR